MHYNYATWLATKYVSFQKYGMLRKFVNIDSKKINLYTFLSISNNNLQVDLL